MPISAILFGGRRPKGVPLIYESYDWEHGVFMGASMRSEATAAAEYKGKVIMHDPFAMRPFFGYNFGDYCQHWLSLQSGEERQMPKIFHVNWFRKSENGEGSFLWPGYGENIRVLEWVFDRVEKPSDLNAKKTPIGYMPLESEFNVAGLGLSEEKLNELFSVDKDWWLNEVEEIRNYFEQNVTDSTPPEIYKQIEMIKERLLKE